MRGITVDGLPGWDGGRGQTIRFIDWDTPENNSFTVVNQYRVDCPPGYTRGKAFIVLPSTAKEGTISRIVPTLTPGTHVSTSKNDINYVVTEYGVAQLRGKTARQRCESLIGIAHPDFRAELTRDLANARHFPMKSAAA
mgnify:CR=1 FL=1